MQTEHSLHFLYAYMSMCSCNNFLSNLNYNKTKSLQAGRHVYEVLIQYRGPLTEIPVSAWQHTHNDNHGKRLMSSSYNVYHGQHLNLAN